MKKNNIKNSIILVTGGAGFIGSQLIESLLRLKPKKIYILDNLYRGKLSNIAQSLKNPRVVLHKGSITNGHKVDKLMSKADYCFHMASMTINSCLKYPKDAFNMMFRGTFNIAESATKYKIKKLIFSSSASIYGLAQHFPTPETDHPYDNRTFYGVGKLFGEGMLRSYHYSYGLNYVALRYFNVYGPRMDTKGKYTTVFINWLKNIKKNIQPIVLGDGSISMDLVFVSDVIKANIQAAVFDINDEVFNIGSGKETTLNELLRLMLVINNSKLKPKFLTAKLMNPVTRRKADITKAKKLLGWKPEVNLREGLKILSDWYFQKK